MEYLIVLIPGIMGSVLQDEDGHDVWAPSARGVVSFLTSFGESVNRLGDNPGGDGVNAVRAIADTVVIPRFWKIDGYSRLRALLVERLDSAGSTRVLVFPYDWRLSNRISAERLKEFVKSNLRDWQERTGARKPKCILIAHSMGGLVCRYYAEVLEGWRDCRALITYATPHRGSVNALDALSNGFGAFGLQFASFSHLARNCASLYELLPRYKMFHADSSDRYIVDVPNLPNVEKDKVQKALEFHFEIERAANTNSSNEEYRTHFATIPIVGTRQKTLQSAAFASDGTVAVSSRLPLDLPKFYSDGDGRVPRLSAVPIGMEESIHVNYLKDQHAAIHNNPQGQEELLDRIGQIEHPEWSAIRGISKDNETAEKLGRALQDAALGQIGICLSLEDVYSAGQPVTVSAVLDVAGTDFDHLDAVIECVDPEGVKVAARMERDGEEFRLLQHSLPAGAYRICVNAPGARFAISVRDVFEVMP